MQAAGDRGAAQLPDLQAEELRLPRGQQDAPRPGIHRGPTPFPPGPPHPTLLPLFGCKTLTGACVALVAAVAAAGGEDRARAGGQAEPSDGGGACSGHQLAHRLLRDQRRPGRLREHGPPRPALRCEHLPTPRLLSRNLPAAAFSCPPHQPSAVGSCAPLRVRVLPNVDECNCDSVFGLRSRGSQMPSQQAATVRTPLLYTCTLSSSLTRVIFRQPSL